jgi:ABC-type nitrate/sulfonate/bicarbonate transport system permease component
MKRVLTYILSLATLLFLWQMASIAVNVINKAPLLPGPFDALSQVVKNAAELQRNFASSAWRLVLAILISLAGAMPLGLLIGREPTLDRFFSPIIYITYPIPQVALILFLFVVFGTGSATKVAMVALVLFFQILVSAQGAAKNIDEEYITSVVSAGATRWQVYWHVVMPSTLPAILTSVRVSIGLGIAFLYIAETQAALGTGLGSFINKHMLFSRDRAFAGIVAMAVLGLLLYVAVDVIERIVCRWKYVKRQSGK